MTMKTCLIAIAAAALAAALAAGCSSVLGFKDPSLDNPAPQDGPTDAPTDAAAIDAAAIDGAIDAPTDTGPAACVSSACTFGCDTATNACRVGVLWVFASTGQFVGDNFGARDGADTRCLATYNASFTSRQCNPARVHAILTIDAADAMPVMATKFSIPITDTGSGGNVPVEVHRADDNVLVANNWNDLTDTTKPPRAPVTTAATDVDGIVWTGANGTSTCKAWASSASTDNGVRGHTTLTSANWMIRDSNPCNTFARLLCICWAGGG